LQVLSLVQTSYNVFYAENPNFTKKLKIKTSVLHSEGLSSFCEDLLSNKIKSINFENLVKLIINYVAE